MHLEDQFAMDQITFIFSDITDGRESTGRGSPCNQELWLFTPHTDDNMTKTDK